nr:ATPase subunit 8 [Leptocoris augur]
MPQMAPLWWETLFILLILCFIMMSVIIYYVSNPKIKNDSNLIKINQFNWKW